MELMIGFAIAMTLVLLLSEDESLEEAADRRWINQMADRDKRQKRREKARLRHTWAGYRPPHPPR